MTARVGPPAALVASVAVLVLSGSALPVPPLERTGAWLHEVGAVVAAVSLARLLALLAALVLLLVWVASAAAEGAGALRLAAGLDRALPPAMRRVLGGVAGVGAVGSALVAVGSAPLPRSAAVGDLGPAVATMAQLDGPEGAPEATMQVVDDTPPAVPAEVESAAGGPDEWVVEPGESFWSIAEEVVAEQLGRMPSDAEVAGYWGRLVEANRSNLRTGDPDLIYPGQRLVLVA